MSKSVRSVAILAMCSLFFLAGCHPPKWDEPSEIVTRDNTHHPCPKGLRIQTSHNNNVVNMVECFQEQSTVNIGWENVALIRLAPSDR